MNPARMQVWTRTLYAIIQSLSISRQLRFGRLDDIEQNVLSASGWTTVQCSYNSVLLSHPMGRSGVTFRRDPDAHFDEIVQQVISMLTQDLVTILDDALAQVLIKVGLNPDHYNFPFDKMAKLHADHPDPGFLWAYHGCIELIECRNVVTHASGRWNQKSINRIAGFIQNPPAVGDQLSIGFDMLFRFRKAIRAFVGRVEVSAGINKPKQPTKKRVGFKGVRKPTVKEIRRDKIDAELRRRKVADAKKQASE